MHPLELVRDRDRTMLLLEDFGGEPLDRKLGSPMEIESFLTLAIGIVSSLGKAHRRGLAHKDIKRANILMNCADGQVRYTAFGIALRLPRERQSPGPPETIASTLAYIEYNASEGACVAVRETVPGLGEEKLSHHGGRLSASQHEAKGAMFQFTIPVIPLDRRGARRNYR